MAIILPNKEIKVPYENNEEDLTTVLFTKDPTGEHIGDITVSSPYMMSPTYLKSGIFLSDGLVENIANGKTPTHNDRDMANIFGKNWEKLEKNCPFNLRSFGRSYGLQLTPALESGAIPLLQRNNNAIISLADCVLSTIADIQALEGEDSIGSTYELEILSLQDRTYTDLRSEKSFFGLKESKEEHVIKGHDLTTRLYKR